MTYDSCVSHIGTLAHQDVEKQEVIRTTLSVPVTLWREAKQFALDGGSSLSANQFAVEGLEMRLAELRKAKKARKC